MKCTITFSILLAVLLAFIAPASAQDEDVATYTAPRTATQLVIDGVLDDDVWKRAPEALMHEAFTGDAIPKTTTVRLLWDDTYLYIGLYGEDDDAWATYDEDDANLWEEEAFETFIDPEKRGHTYYEINVNPLGRVVDLFIANTGNASDTPEFRSLREWDAEGLKHAVHVEGSPRKGTRDAWWSAEIAVPFTELWIAERTPPRVGDVWRMNFFRIERGATDDTKDDWRASFSNTKGQGFHAPRRFGKVTFGM